MEGEEGAEDENKGTTQTVIKMVEQDQKDKALAVKGRDIPGMPGQSILVINRYAARAYREEFLEYINRTYPEFFDENDDLESINQAINLRGQTDIDEFIKKTCGEYTVPCLEFEINAPDL
jgi:hypothetical protein